MPAGKPNFGKLWRGEITRWRTLRHKQTGEILRVFAWNAWGDNTWPTEGPWIGHLDEKRIGSETWWQVNEWEEIDI